MMDFSVVMKESGPWAWSPDGTLLAACDSSRLVVRDTRTLMVMAVFSNSDTSSKVEWSHDNRFVLCAMYKRGIVQVWDIQDPTWACRIAEGPAGLAYSRWAPDGRHILNTAEFNVRITVWSLSSTAGVVASLRAPKHADKGIDASSDGKFLAVAERDNCKDYIQLYRCSNWTPIRRFAIDTKDVVDLKWSPDDRAIGVWDSAYEGALGIKTVQWSPSGQFVAIGSFDQKARILNHLTWRPIEEYAHPQSLIPAAAIVYREKDLSGAISQSITGEHGAHAVANSAYELVNTNEAISLATIKCDPEKANPKMGVGLLEWSLDSSMLMTRNDNAPNSLWIWDTRQLILHSLLIQLAPIKHARWDPTRTRVAMCTGSRTVHLWSPQGASCIQVPLPGFSVNRLEWNSKGTCLLLVDRDVYCIAFLSNQEQ